MNATPEDFSKAAQSFVQKLFPQIGDVQYISITGKLKDKRPVSFSYGYSSFDYQETGGDKIYLRWTEVGKTTPAYTKGMRTRVESNGIVTKKDQLQGWAKMATKFLEDNGVPHGTAKPKKVVKK